MLSLTRPLRRDTTRPSASTASTPTTWARMAPYRMHVEAAGVGGDHAADGGAVPGGQIDREGQARPRLAAVLQPGQRHAGPGGHLGGDRVDRVEAGQPHRAAARPRDGGPLGAAVARRRRPARCCRPAPTTPTPGGSAQARITPATSSVDPRADDQQGRAAEAPGPVHLERAPACPASTRTWGPPTMSARGAAPGRRPGRCGGGHRRPPRPSLACAHDAGRTPATGHRHHRGRRGRRAPQPAGEAQRPRPGHVRRPGGDGRPGWLATRRCGPSSCPARGGASAPGWTSPPSRPWRSPSRGSATSTATRLGDRAAGRITNHGQQAAFIWTELPVPVIAAVHGVALGGGLQIALARRPAHRGARRPAVGAGDPVGAHPGHDRHAHAAPAGAARRRQGADLDRAHGLRRGGGRPGPGHPARRRSPRRGPGPGRRAGRRQSRMPSGPPSSCSTSPAW